MRNCVTGHECAVVRKRKKLLRKLGTANDGEDPEKKAEELQKRVNALTKKLDGVKLKTKKFQLAQGRLDEEHQHGKTYGGAGVVAVSL